MVLAMCRDLTTWGSQRAFKYQFPDESRQSQGSLMNVEYENGLEALRMLA